VCRHFYKGLFYECEAKGGGRGGNFSEEKRLQNGKGGIEKESFFQQKQQITRREERGKERHFANHGEPKVQKGGGPNSERGCV